MAESGGDKIHRGPFSRFAAERSDLMVKCHSWTKPDCSAAVTPKDTSQKKNSLQQCHCLLFKKHYLHKPHKLLVSGYAQGARGRH